MLSTKKINEKVVRPLNVPKIDPERIKGYDLFPEIYCNVFLCAKKKSGKTSVIAKILRECCNKETRVICFCATHNKDPSYIAIKEMLKSRQIEAHFFDSIVDENKLDKLEKIIEELKQDVSEGEEEKEEEEEEKKDRVCLFFEEGENVKVKIKKKKPKKIAPKIIFIFDDISTELKNKNVPRLLKTNRHFKSKVIISSQYPNDVEPGSRRQFDYWILFKGHSDEKLEIVHQNASLSHEFKIFKSIYEYATEGNYNFLYIDTNKNKYRKNFDSEIIFSGKI